MQHAAAAVMLRPLQCFLHGLTAGFGMLLGELEEAEDFLTLGEAAMHAPLISCSVRVRPGILHSLCRPNTKCHVVNLS